MIEFVSLFAGIGGFDLGFERAGMRCLAQVEIDDGCRSVLAEHWPGVDRSITNVRKFGAATWREPVDLACGGFPCQDVSVAGRGAGLAGERSGLWFEFHRVLAELRPRWVVVENVPGLLSSNGGRDFAIVVQGLAELGYLSAWRVLDAQYCGVAQKRRRVFVVGHLGDGRAVQVLFEPESCERDSAPSRETGSHAADTLTARFADHRGASAGDYPGLVNAIIAYQCHGGNVGPLGALRSGNGSLTGGVPFVSSTLGSHRGRNDLESMGAYVATWDPRGVTSKENRATITPGAPANTLHAAGLSVLGEAGVRRLTPRECERLQGFPDVEKCVIMDVCLDHQKNVASVEISNPKSQKPVGNAERTGLSSIVSSAESCLKQSDPRTNRPALRTVHINCGERGAEIHSQGRLLLSVSFAERPDLFPRLTQTEDFAHLIVGINSIVEKIINPGRAVSPQSEQCLTRLQNGESSVKLFGTEMMLHASDVARDSTTTSRLLKSITSSPLSTENLDLTLAILFFSVYDAISGYIPAEILNGGSFRIKIVSRFGWTYPQSDSARYRQLGNAVAAPVAEWIGRRIVNLQNGDRQ